MVVNRKSYFKDKEEIHIDEIDGTRVARGIEKEQKDMVKFILRLRNKPTVANYYKFMNGRIILEHYKDYAKDSLYLFSKDRIRLTKLINKILKRC